MELYAKQLMIYCPDIYPESFVHLSIRGEGYYIRAFTGPRGYGGKWKLPDVYTTSDLLRRFQFTHQIDVSGAEDRVNLENKEYWEDRTIKLNRQYSI